MIARLSMLCDRLATSLWALPTALVVAAGATAILATRLPIAQGADPVWWLYSGDTAGASDFIANLLTAMITMATLAISITMVVLTLAAQSLGPRLIQIFLADTRTKLALGLFVGTVVYLLIALRSVVGDTDTVPNLAVTLGALLVMASVVALPFFLHHLARSIVADTIIERVGQTLDSWIPVLLPEREAASDETRPTFPEDGGPFTATASGYIQAIDRDAAVAAACKSDVVVMFRLRPGHLVLRGDTLGHVSPPDRLDEDLAATLAKAVVCGPERTPVQEIEYSIRQLVEIALRALSPGVNDPNTATAVVDRVAISIAAVMHRGPQQSLWRDNDDLVRLYVPPTDFAGMIDAAFNQIRQAGASQPAILIRLVDRLGQLLAHADAGQARVVARHIELLRATGLRAIPDEADRSAFADRVAEALANGRDQEHG